MKKRLCSMAVAILLLMSGLQGYAGAYYSGWRVFGRFQYTVTKQGTVTIMDYRGGEEIVVVPGKIKGKPVTKIGGWAFWRHKMKEVILPKSIEVIGSTAFAECKQLTSINIPKKVRRIGDRAFQSCVALQTIKIPNSVQRIEGWAFEGCKRLKKVELGNGLKRIDSATFANCPKLRSLTLPKTVTRIKAPICSGAKRVNLTVAQENETYFADQNVIYSKDGKTVVDGSAARGKIKILDTATIIGTQAFQGGLCQSVFIPGSVKTIKEHAFGSSKLEEVTLSEGLETIDSWAFEYTPIKKLYIPKTVKTVGWESFYGCHFLKKLTVAEGVKQIHYHAFMDCTRLKSVTLARSVKLDGSRKYGLSANFGYIDEEIRGYMPLTLPRPMDEFVVRGYKGTDAEKYAKQHGFTFKAIG